MIRKTTEINELKEYFAAVMSRADHHAGNVNDVALTLAGAVIWRKDPDHDIEVYELDGEMKNVLWVHVEGTRYALLYNHEGKTIDVRQKSKSGKLLRSFTNKNSAANVAEFFATL